MVKVPPWQCPSSASVPPQGAPGSSGWLSVSTERDRPTGRPAAASGARASRLQSHRPPANQAPHLRKVSRRPPRQY